LTIFVIDSIFSIEIKYFYTKFRFKTSRMSLKIKVITLSIGIFSAFAIVVYAVHHLILLPAFVELERTAATNNTERAVQALGREVESLIPSTTDWATWNDTYQFMDDRNEEFVKAHLSLNVLENLKVNLLGIYTLEGRRLWGMVYDYEIEEEVALQELSEDSLNPTNPLLGTPDSMDTVAGLYSTSAGIYMVASRPILSGKGVGPSRGRFIMGRQLNKVAIDRLAVQARVLLSVSPLLPVEGSKLKPLGNNDKIRYTPITLEESDAITHGTTNVLDVTGAPILRFQVDSPRTIVAQGRTTLKYTAMFLALAGTVFLLVFLIRHAIAVGTHGDLSARLQIKSKDEIGTLAHEFDIMVERLAETRQRLLDQSYLSGLAEMASGTLHNIGNAITPIGVKLINLRRELLQAPVAEMAMAAAELADSATAADRRADLVRFSELAGAELATLVESTADELGTIRAQVDLVQMILADQQRFSRAERIIEPLALFHLIKETARLLPENLHHIMTIEIDQGLAEIGHINAARIALQQVISNLFINAAESIGEKGRQGQTGRIRVYTVATDAANQGMAHICFEDNGIGIHSDQLSQLFERSFSTKQRGSGIGLHWCANTVSAMGGCIYAESPGPGQGACMHLLLPLAKPVI
jgi:sensor domain CHASE-containing protein